jgi:uncharacterized protein
MDLKFYLEDRLGQSVDLVSHKVLKPQIRQTVKKEAIRVAQPLTLYRMGRVMITRD